MTPTADTAAAPGAANEPPPLPNRVFLTGGNGFVGRYVVRELIARGLHPVCLVRDKSVFVDRMRQFPPDKYTAVGGSMFDDAALAGAATGADAVIHLVGIIQERPMMGQTFERVHVEGTRRVVGAAKAAGVRRFVHMSALGTRQGAAAEYHRTKWQAEAIVRESGLDWTIFRPSIIHGHDGEFMQMMRTFVCDALVTSMGFIPVPFPVVPYFGRGDKRLQPVDVRDVAACFVGALLRPETAGKVFDLGGPEAVSWKELYRICRETIPGAKAWKPVVSTPVPVAKLLARTVMKLPVLPMALRFNVGQVQMSQEDSVCDIGPVEKAFGIKLRDFRTELKQYAAMIA